MREVVIVQLSSGLVVTNDISTAIVQLHDLIHATASVNLLKQRNQLHTANRPLRLFKQWPVHILGIEVGFPTFRHNTPVFSVHCLTVFVEDRNAKQMLVANDTEVVVSVRVLFEELKHASAQVEVFHELVVPFVGINHKVFNALDEVVTLLLGGNGVTISVTL